MSVIGRYDAPEMRVAVRKFRNRVILESRRPQSGVYWWIPSPDGAWELDVYYDSEFKDTAHDKLWRNYVVDRLAMVWGKDRDKLKQQIGDNYTALPRGRISAVRGPHQFVFVHGNDAPIDGAVDKVLSAFNLGELNRLGKVLVTPDVHETMLAGDPERLQEVLKTDLGLEGSLPDLEDDEDESL